MSFPFRCRRHLGAPVLSLGLAASMFMGGCARYRPEPVDPTTVRDTWAAIDDRAASEAVHAAMQAGAIPTQQYDLSDGISLAEAEITALFFNPSIRATRLQAGVPEAMASFAGLWEDPELGIDGDYILDNVDEPWVLGATLSITIPISGRRGVAKELAKDKSAAAQALVVGAEWALLNTVRELWAESARQEAELKLLEDAAAELQRLLELAPQFRAAQAMSIIDERMLRIQRQRVLDDIRQLRADRAEQQLVLFAALGLHPQHDWQLQVGYDDLAQFAEPIDDDVLANPLMRQVMAAYQVAERSLHLEVRKQYPDLVIGLGAGSEEGDSRILFGLGLIPTPMWNANRQGIAAATAERKVAAAQIEEAIQDLVHRQAMQARRLSQAKARLHFIENDLAPLVDEQVVDAKRLSGLGELDLFLLADALEEAREVRLELLEARAVLQLNRLNSYALGGPKITAEDVTGESTAVNNEKDVPHE